MCGIVAYFGSAPNSISRVITGMSAIIYRAPDSTGIGTFGDLSGAVTVRKALGSVSQIVDVLNKNPLNGNPDKDFLNMWKSETMTGLDMQKKILEFEGLSLEIFEKCVSGELAYPLIQDLFHKPAAMPVPVFPGYPGKPDPDIVFTFKSRKELQKIVRCMVHDYDLSFVAVKAIFRGALCRKLCRVDESEFEKAGKSDIFNAFDQLFSDIFKTYRPAPPRSHAKRIHLNPHAKNHLWKLMSNTSISLPPDFQTDGISCLFRILDQAVVSKILHQPSIEEELQKLVDISFSDAGISRSPAWRTLYQAEKSVNVYGRAAGAVLEWFQKKEILRGPAASTSHNTPETMPVTYGKTNITSLNYLIQPVIAHGRWALQSAVTLKNAHPFMDEKKQRLIVLNGQFSSDVEDELKEYLSGIARFFFRTDNSSEYFSLLWGYYYDVLYSQQVRFQQVMDLTQKGLEGYSVGSSSISYRRLKQVQGKSARALDESAFIEAVKRFSKNGGQIAVTGISITSPHTLYVASCNRPVFIVKRHSSHDYMVVSDINAALGLFSQSGIKSVTREYERLVRSREKEIQALQENNPAPEELDTINSSYRNKIDRVLSRFKVDVFTLEGNEIFAKIYTVFENGPLKRRVVIKDFDNHILHDIEHETVNLTPPHVHKILDKSFFETHLEETPDLLEAIIKKTIRNGLDIAAFDIDVNRLEKRFGRKMKSLDRIFIAGMGTSYHTALFASCLVKKICPGIEVICIQPVEINLPLKLFSSDTDLVLLISWSSTTAEMVEFSKTLLAMNILFAVFTEKPFGDLGILARKSLGTIPVMSGEEVTVSAVKSLFCSLLMVDLFILWFSRDLLCEKTDVTVSGGLLQIPGIIRQMIVDPGINKTGKMLASSLSDTEILFIIDPLHAMGTGYEAALKIEEMTWSLKTLAIDYADVDMAFFNSIQNKAAVVINATCHEQLGPAVEIMKRFDEDNIDFFALACETAGTEEIESLSKGNCHMLPAMDDCFQPFADLVFYYLLSFYAGQSRGRKPDDYPRNRVKSVTASRSWNPLDVSFRKEFFNLRQREVLISEKPVSKQNVLSPTHWQTQNLFDKKTVDHFELMKRFGQRLFTENLFDQLMVYDTAHLENIASLMFDTRQSREFVFFPLDLQAQAAVQTAVTNLNRLLPCRMRVLNRSSSVPFVPHDAVIVMVSSQGGMNRIPRDPAHIRNAQSIWFGPDVAGAGSTFSLGTYVVKDTGATPINDIILYSCLILWFIHAWKIQNHERAGLVETHFQKTANIIFSILNDMELGWNIVKVMDNNKAYHSILYLCPCDGTGISFARNLLSCGKWLVKHLCYGMGAHGPLVTVDNRVDEKFIRLENRDDMVGKYGNTRVAKWESKYLDGEPLDAYLEKPHNNMAGRIEAPFFAQENWYLPILKPGYPVFEDNLIILDATNERYYNQALDDLAVFGCRHARIIAITQQAFLKESVKKGLQRFPLSGMFSIPAFNGREQAVPLSDIHLPFALNLIAAAIAGC